MTCIVGIAQDGQVTIGGDSLGSTFYSKQVYTTPKVFRRGAYLIGYCGDYRFGQLLQHAWTPPKPTKNLDRFLVTTFADSLFDVLSEGRWARIKNNVIEGGNFVLGVQGRVFNVEDNFQVIEPATNEAATGSGLEYALGSLHSTRGQKPKARVLAALAAASEFEPHVGGPFVVKVR